MKQRDATLLLAACLFSIAPLNAVEKAKSAGPGSRAQLSALVEKLQKSPSDNALREKAISLARSLKPAPAIPEEARRPFVRGNTAFADAKSREDFARAATLFDSASNLAPWWPDPYFNLAKAREAMEDYDGALGALQFYLKAATEAADKRQAQDLSYALEEKRDRKKSNDAAAASIDRFIGTWGRMVKTVSGPFKQTLSITKENGGLRFSGNASGPTPPYDVVVEKGDLVFTIDYTMPTNEGTVTYGSARYRGTLTSDGRTMSFTFTPLPPRPGELEIQQKWVKPSDAFGNDQPWTRE